MKVLICGDRNYTDEGAIRSWLCKLQDWGYDTVINGGAKGADSIAAQEARKMGFTVITIFPEWHIYGRGAGPVRNKEMLDLKPDLVVAFHKDIAHSKGTRNMMSQAEQQGVKVILEEG